MRNNGVLHSHRNPLSYLVRKTWQYSGDNKSKVVIFWSMFVCANLVELLPWPLLWAKIIDIVTREGINRQTIGKLSFLLGGVVVLEVVFWCFHGPARIMERANAFRVKGNYRKYLLKGVLSLPIDWHVDHHSGDTIDRIEKGANGLYDFSESSFLVISAITHFVVSYIMLTYFSPPAALIVLVMVAISIWITMRLDRAIVAQYKELNRSENNVSESIFDAISNVATVVILRVERLIFKAIVRKIDKPFALYNRNNRLVELKWFLTSICCAIMTMLVLLVYFWEHLGTAKGVLVGSVYLLINYLNKVSELFFRFTSMYGEILKRKAKVANAEELAVDFVGENFTNHVLPQSWNTLQISGLNFAYQGEDEHVLHLRDISLSIGRGERIAFVGETGSGKTTFLKVIRDLYHPKSVALSVDGTAIPEGFQGISQAIALVPQNPEIFATTILENITLGAEYDESFIRQFTDMACFTDVAEKLPRKMETSIKEKGVNLSGGQQQRLALSRGLLACHNKDIVLLDEPTSSLDTVTEMNVYQNIFRAFSDKTVISTIHRLHLLPLFDKIYLFGQGAIVGAGSLNELLSSNTMFQQLWQKSLIAHQQN